MLSPTPIAHPGEPYRLKPYFATSGRGKVQPRRSPWTRPASCVAMLRVEGLRSPEKGCKQQPASRWNGQVGGASWHDVADPVFCTRLSRLAKARDSTLEPSPGPKDSPSMTGKTSLMQYLTTIAQFHRTTSEMPLEPLATPSTTANFRALYPHSWL